MKTSVTLLLTIYFLSCQNPVFSQNDADGWVEDDAVQEIHPDGSTIIDSTRGQYGQYTSPAAIPSGFPSGASGSMNRQPVGGSPALSQPGFKSGFFDNPLGKLGQGIKSVGGKTFAGANTIGKSAGMRLADPQFRNRAANVLNASWRSTAIPAAGLTGPPGTAAGINQYLSGKPGNKYSLSGGYPGVSRLPTVTSPPLSTFTGQPINSFGSGASSSSGGNTQLSTYGSGYLGQLSINKYTPNAVNPSAVLNSNSYMSGGPMLFDSAGNYHGRLNSNKYDADSISNPYGKYGSVYSSDSINNKYGAGSSYNSDSPFNKYGSGMKIIAP